MLLPHLFDKLTHTYRVPGEYVIATSDLAKWNGLCDFSQVPVARLREASAKGVMLDNAIQWLEEDCLAGYDNGVLDPAAFDDDLFYELSVYLHWKQQNNFIRVGDCQHRMVYRHDYTGQLIGGTCDLRGFVNGQLNVIDLKRIYPRAGKAKQQKLTEWRLQLASYWEGSQQDEAFWEAAGGHQQLGKMILHIHPEHAKYRQGVEVHTFPEDDSDFLNAAIIMARTKMGGGFELPQKEY